MSPIGPDSNLGVARSIKALRARVDNWRANKLTVAFVPTMGALHQGHISLIKRAGGLADRTVASIFVNPAQFAAHEDLDAYPRDEARDLTLLQAAGCSLAYTPPAAEMYPPGFQTAVAVSEISQGLCGASRPHFFGGVATVVCKLLNQCRPDVAVFGEKDFQQLLVIRRMVRDLDMDVDIVGAPIVREPDGLAMSSRNAYLSADERRVAGAVNLTLAKASAKLLLGQSVSDVMHESRRALEAAGVASIDYFEARRESDLAPLGPGPLGADTVSGADPARLFAAVFVGATRLIDNWPIAAGALKPERKIAP